GSATRGDPGDDPGQAVRAGRRDRRCGLLPRLRGLVVRDRRRAARRRRPRHGSLTPTTTTRTPHHPACDSTGREKNMGILEGKNLLITGVITEASMAFHTARLAQEQGATVVLTGYGRLSLVERIAQRLPKPAPVIELDVTNPEQVDGLAAKVAEHVPHLDGVLHSIGFAPAG